MKPQESIPHLLLDLHYYDCIFFACWTFLVASGRQERKRAYAAGPEAAGCSTGISTARSSAKLSSPAPEVSVYSQCLPMPGGSRAGFVVEKFHPGPSE